MATQDEEIITLESPSGYDGAFGPRGAFDLTRPQLRGAADKLVGNTHRMIDDLSIPAASEFRRAFESFAAQYSAWRGEVPNPTADSRFHGDVGRFMSHIDRELARHAPGSREHALLSDLREDFDRAHYDVLNTSRDEFLTFRGNPAGRQDRPVPPLPGQRGASLSGTPITMGLPVSTASLFSLKPTEVRAVALPAKTNFIG